MISTMKPMCFTLALTGAQAFFPPLERTRRLVEDSKVAGVELNLYEKTLRAIFESVDAPEIDIFHNATKEDLDLFEAAAQRGNSNEDLDPTYSGCREDRDTEPAHSNLRGRNPKALTDERKLVAFELMGNAFTAAAEARYFCKASEMLETYLSDIIKDSELREQATLSACIGDRLFWKCYYQHVVDLKFDVEFAPLLGMLKDQLTMTNETTSKHDAMQTTWTFIKIVYDSIFQMFDQANEYNHDFGLGLEEIKATSKDEISRLLEAKIENFTEDDKLAQVLKDLNTYAKKLVEADQELRQATGGALKLGTQVRAERDWMGTFRCYVLCLKWTKFNTFVTGQRGIVRFYNKDTNDITVEWQDHKYGKLDFHKSKQEASIAVTEWEKYFRVD